MEAAAHTKGGFGGVPQSVGKDFVKADKMKNGGLYANIHAKQQRIAAGSGEHMRKPGSKGAPTAKDFKESEKTAKKKNGGEVSLTLGRKEINPTSKGAGLTAKGRETHLQAPQPEGGPRKNSFCARMEPVAKKSEPGSRARASMQRWKCPNW